VKKYNQKGREQQLRNQCKQNNTQTGENEGKGDKGRRILRIGTISKGTHQGTKLIRLIGGGVHVQKGVKTWGGEKEGSLGDTARLGRLWLKMDRELNARTGGL